MTTKIILVFPIYFYYRCILFILISVNKIITGSSSPSVFQVPNLSPTLRSYNPGSSLKSNKEQKGGGKKEREGDEDRGGEKKWGKREREGGREAGREL